MDIQTLKDETEIQDIIVELFKSLSAIRELSELNSQAQSEKELIKHALAVLMNNQDMERCSLFLLNDQGFLINLTGLGVNDLSLDSSVKPPPLQFKIGKGVIGIAAEKGEIQNCQNCQEDERFIENSQQQDRLIPGSIISAPIFTTGDKLIGVLNISHPQAYHFNEWHIRLLEIYKNILGQLISNYRLFQKMEEQIEVRTARIEETLEEMQVLKDHYKSISLIDQLTGLHNRRYFYKQVGIAIDNAKRYEQSLCLLILDLDHFKDVNDTYGHGFGDIVLKNVSEVLQQQVRSTDILVRYGGEEFVIVFNNTDIKKGKVFSERIRTKIESFTWTEKKEFIQTVSIGLYYLNIEHFEVNKQEEINIDHLIHYADTALYKAKEQGRNKVIIFTEDMLKK